MSYISVNFIYFLIIFLVAYSVTKKQWVKRSILLLGNLIFYYWAGKSAIVIIFTSTIIVYFAARLIDKIYAGYQVEAEVLSPPEKLKLFKQYKKKTIYIVAAVLLLLLSIFAYVKVGKYVGLESTGLKDFSWGKSMIVPIGLSYYTLSMIGYLVDVYRDKTQCEKNFLTFAACVTFFPHIIQGPISRYDKLLGQLKVLPAFDYEKMCYGLQLMLWGYLKKLVLADTIYLYTTQVFSNMIENSLRNVAVGIVLYAIQLYADFSGCIDIVTGISEVMGLQLDKNFERPFFSRSAGEFWRRWHISLGVWFKEYIYMPIAMSSRFKNIVKKIRKNRGRQWGIVVSVAVPSLAVWILTGIWHGTGLDYVVWGLYWGSIIILSEILADKYAAVKQRLHIKEESFFYSVFQRGRTFLIYCVGLLIIIDSSIPYVTGNIHRTATDNRIIVLGSIFLFIVECIQERLSRQGLTIRSYIASKHILIRWSIYFAALIVLIIFGRIGIGYNADTFIYAGF